MSSDFEFDGSCCSLVNGSESIEGLYGVTKCRIDPSYRIHDVGMHLWKRNSDVVLENTTIQYRLIVKNAISKKSNGIHAIMDSLSILLLDWRKRKSHFNQRVIVG